MVNMQMVSTFPRSPDAHFVDIHEVPEEEEQEQEHRENGTGVCKRRNTVQQTNQNSRMEETLSEFQQAIFPGNWFFGVQ